MENHNSVPARVILFFTCCFVWLAFPVRGNTLTWTGTGANAYWNNSANWGGFGIPANGDTLIFTGFTNYVNTNNIANLTLNSIKFYDFSSSFDLRGNAFTLTNSIIDTNFVGSAIIENNITLATADVLLRVDSIFSTLTLEGQLTGSVGVNKTGTGRLLYQYGGNNTYTGTTLVGNGYLELNVSGSSAFGGPLVIGDGSGSNSIVQLLQSVEISTAADISLNKDGLLDLNGFYQTIGTNVLFNGTASAIFSGSGGLSLLPNCTITLATGVVGSITGNLNIGSGTLNIVGDNGPLFSQAIFSVSANVSGSANITQNGWVDSQWSGTNTYSAIYTANGPSFIVLANSQALGNPTNTMTLNGRSAVQLSGNIHVTNQWLTINSTNVAYDYALSVESTSTNSWQANFLLGTNVMVDVATNCSLILNINSSITGPGGIIKSDKGGLTLAGGINVSSYIGDTTVLGGTLFLDSVNVIRYGRLTVGSGSGQPKATAVRYLANSCIYGGPGGSTVLLNEDGWLDLNGFFDDVGPIAMDGATITTGAGMLSLFPPLTAVAGGHGSAFVYGNMQLTGNSALVASNALVVYAQVSSSGNYTLTKSGPSFLFLLASNSYAGTNIVQQGWLSLGNGSALGSANNSTIVSNGATLTMNGNFTVTQALLTLNGPGEPSWGSLDSETIGGTNVWMGPIVLNADSNFSPDQEGTTLRLISQISGPGGFTQFNDAGDTNSVLSLEGNAVNSYGGTTIVNGGTLMLSKASGQAVPGNLVINNQSVARLGYYTQNAQTADVLVNSGGLFDLSIYYTYIDTLHGTGQVNFGTQGWIEVGFNNGSSTFAGVMTGTGYTSGGYTVAKRGSGTFTLTGNNTFTAGATHVFSPGKLIINGSQAQVPAIVDAGATLGGTGTVGAITANGVISPGTNGPGVLGSGTVTYGSTGSLAVMLNGTTVGSGYSELNVAGTVNLASATLSVIPGTPGAINNQYTILNNDLFDAVSGTFAGLAEGATVVANNGALYTISYHGGSGNDVVLTQIALPSLPKFTGIQKLMGGALQINGIGISNLTYTVQANTNLATTNWVAIGTTTPPANTNTLQFTDFNAISFPQRFYRFYLP
ncbi:MAG TPA: autotransporter-associated beta strand repeat-containing protein [Verrucomicrobiae bacterium]|nr:autotransporter-associated beta strand repeat-containing protein [Verrucomicrobiae bacterium]